MCKNLIMKNHFILFVFLFSSLSNQAFSEIFPTSPNYKVEYAGNLKKIKYLFNPDLQDVYKSVPVSFVNIVNETGTLKVTASSKITSHQVYPKYVNSETRIEGNFLTIENWTGSKLAIKINDFEYLFILRDQEDNQVESLGYRINFNDSNPDNSGKTKVTQLLQNVIDKAAQSNIKSYIFIGPGQYQVGTIYLKSNVYLFLDPDAVLVGSLDVEDYPRHDINKDPKHDISLSPFTSGSLIYAENIQNSGILGFGTIYGRGFDFRKKYKYNLGNAPDFKKAKLRNLNIIRLINTKNITISGLNLVDPVFWNTHILRSSNIDITNVKVINELVSNDYIEKGVHWNNTDGINPDASSNVLIRNIFAYCGDDCITLKITNSMVGEHPSLSKIKIEDCMLMSSTAGIKIGTESLGKKLNDIRVNDILFLPMDQGRNIGIETKDQALVSNVRFSNLYIENDLVLLAVNLSKRTKNQSYETKVKGLVLKNIFNKNKPKITLNGVSEDNPIEKVTIKNIFIDNKKVTNIGQIDVSGQFFKKIDLN